MRRKSHVSFLGEDATVTSRPYPTNGTRQGMASVCWAIMDIAPPADRRGPPRSEILAEQDKPVVLPATAGEPQGTLLVLRVEDCGKSERPPVMGWIPAALWPDAKAGRLPCGHSWRENLINRYTGEGR